MGRDAKKAVTNIWYKARMEASKEDPRLKSREGAAEVLGMSACAVADTELGALKVMPPEKALRMAEVYKAPWLLNWFCKMECPIGGRIPMVVEEVSLERATVHIIKELRDTETLVEALVDIAEDGEITPDEFSGMESSMERLEKLQIAVSELRVIWERVRNVKTGG